MLTIFPSPPIPLLGALRRPLRAGLMLWVMLACMRLLAQVPMVPIPSSVNVAPGDNFDITIEIQAGTQPLAAADVYFNFDPSVVQVTSITDGAFPISLANSFDNTTGRVDYNGSSLTSNLTGTFDLVTISFTALGAGSTGFTYDFALPTQTGTFFTGANFSQPSDVVSPTITVVSPNTAPSVNITAPTTGATFTQGDNITFTGTASDAEDGPLDGSISWSSSLDGPLGSGASVSSSTLSVGTHTITASVTDAGSLSASDDISITVNAAPPVNTTPVITAIGNQTVAENGTLSLPLSITDADGDNLTVSITTVSNEPQDLQSNNSGTQVDPFPTTADGFFTETGVSSSAGSYSASLDFAPTFGDGGGADGDGSGSYTITVQVDDQDGNSVTETFDLTVNDVAQALAATGTVRVEAESFDNQGPPYPGSGTNGIGVEVNNPGVTNIGFTNNGDFAEYEIDVPVAGDYEFTFAVANGNNTAGNMAISVGGGTLGTLTTANTSGWQAYVDSVVVVTLPAGPQTLRFDWSGPNGFYFNLDYFDVTYLGTSADVTPPVITLLGDNPLELNVGDPYNEPGATANDNVDGDISGSIVIDATAVDVNTVGSYDVTYNVSDAAGNAATEVIRTVNVNAVVVPDLAFDSSPQILNAETGQSAGGNFTLSASDNSSPTGIALASNQSWLTVPATTDAGVATSFTVDAASLEAGTYNATVTASATDYNGANLEVYFVVAPSAPANPADAICINVNGPAFTAGSGLAFLSDADAATQGYISGGSTFGSPNGSVDFAGTDDDLLYQAERFGGNNGNNPINFNIPVPNGDYQVVLHFAEIYHGVAGASPDPDPGLRVFDVSLEGNVVLDDLDLLDAAAGGITGVPQVAIVHAFDQTVIDGEINITVNADPAAGGVDNGKISAVCIIPTNVPPPNTAPQVTITAPANGATVIRGVPTNFTATANDLEDGNISASLSWSSTIDAGFSGTGASITDDLFTDTTHQIIATVTDNDGAIGSDTIEVVVPGPSVDIVSPVDGAILTSTDVTIDWDAVGVISSVGEHYHLYVNPADPANPDPNTRISTADSLGQTDWLLTAADGIVAGTNTVVIIAAEALHTEFTNPEARDQVTFDVNLPDTDPPVITLLGDDPLELTVGDPYVEPGATANDNVDGDISANITIDASAVDVNTVGSYQVTYNVSDAAGNAATEVIRTVNVNAAPITDVFFVVEPATANVAEDSIFDLTVVVQANDQPVDLAEVYLNFDPAVLQVLSVTPGTTLTVPLVAADFDNTAGTVEYGAGLLGSSVDGTFDLLTIEVQAVGGPSTPVDFFDPAGSPATTNATSGGANVLTGTTGATVNVTVDPALVITPNAFTESVAAGGSATNTFAVTTNDGTALPGDLALSSNQPWLTLNPTNDGYSIDATGLAVGSYQATITATGTGYDAGLATVDLTVTAPLIPSALVEITPGTGLTASTFSNNAYQITNTGEVDITSVEIDLSTAILPDMVWDPVGAGGDATSSCFTPNSGAGATGLIAPTDPCVDPFSVPRQGGFDVLTVNFNDFSQSEQFLFTTDIDPNSIQGVPNAGFAGAVSGYELIGATVTITFADGTVFTGNLYEEGTLGGSQVILAANPTAAPSIALQSDPVASQALVDDLNQTITVSGTPGDHVSLLQMDARLFIASGNPPFNVADTTFYANEAMSGKNLYTGVIGSGGTLDIPVTLLQTPGSSGTPSGGKNHFIAVTSAAPYAVDQQTSATSNVLVVKFDPSLVCTDTTVFDSTTTCDPLLAGNDTTVFVTPLGCDSTVIAVTTLLPSDTTNIAATTCDPAQAGVVNQLFTNQFGCDSLVITTTTLLPSDTTNLAEAICDGESFLFDGNSLTAAGTYQAILINQSGCDSVVNLTLTVNPTYNLTVNETILPGGNFDFGGITYSNDTTVTETFQTAVGCDSVVTLNLTVAQPVVLSVDPANLQVGVGQSFSVDILLSTGTQEVDAFSVELSFDPTLLQIDSVTEQANLEFPLALGANHLNIDNTNGVLDYTRASFGPYPSGTITLATVNFTALASTVGTPFSFVTTGLTPTDVTAPSGTSVITGTVDGNIEIQDVGDLVIDYLLQGRSTLDLSADEYGDNFDVALYKPGTDTLVASYPDLIGTPTGQLTVNSLPLGNYDVWVKHSKYLARLKNVTIGIGANTLALGEMRTGDADDNNNVAILDFSILNSTFGLVPTMSGFDSRADFNADGVVSILDFSLLNSSFGLSGADPGGAYSLRTRNPGMVNAVVALDWVFSSGRVEPGELVTARLIAHTNGQALDGVEAHLDFNPDFLEVQEVAMGNALSVILTNAYDNTSGRIDLAAGLLEESVTGNIEVATVTFRAKSVGTAEVDFKDRAHLQQGATFDGFSVLGSHQGDVLAIDANTDIIQNESIEQALNMDLYPVPSGGRITVSINAPADVKLRMLQIYNSAGQLILEKEVSQTGRYQFDLSGYAKGVYRVQLITESKVVHRNAIIE